MTTSTETPVILPPGRARLATMPASTGTAKIPTIGIVVVAALKSRVKSLVPMLMITSGLRLTMSRAKSA